MSKRAREIDYLLDLRADFDQFLLEKDEVNARLCIEEMGERGEELEALKMHQEFNAAFNDVVPFEQEIPVITEAEKNAWTEPKRFLASTESTFGVSEEQLEQMHLTSLNRQIDAR